MIDAYEIYVVTDEPGPYTTIFDFEWRLLGRYKSLIIDDPDIPEIPAKWAYNSDQELSARQVAPWLGSVGSGIFQAVLLQDFTSLEEFESYGFTVYQLGKGGVLLDPSTSLPVGAISPTSGDDVFDLSRNPYNGILDALGGNDVVRGSDRRDVVLGGRGNDELLGRGGADELSEQSGKDKLDGGRGSDRLSGGNNADNLNGGAGNDTLSGGAGKDRLLGGGGNDELFGGDGNDKLMGGAGQDLINGGRGIDVAIYTRDSSVSVDLSIGKYQTTNGAGIDKLVSIENLIGSEFADSLWGNGRANDIKGLRGSDSIFGRAGNDRLDGGDGNDALDGGSGADSLLGGDGSDILRGGQGRDLLNGGSGEGEDFADYSGSTAVKVDLNRSGYQSIAGHGSDKLVAIEGVIGSSEADVLIGHSDSRLDSHLEGGSGRDRLIATAGDNFLSGGAGADTFKVVIAEGRSALELQGGAGNDRIKVDASDAAFFPADINGGSGRDRFDIRLDSASDEFASLRASIEGGAGADTFLIRGSKTDIQINDFQDGIDVIRIVDAAATFSDLEVRRGNFEWIVSVAGSGDTDFRINLIDPELNLRLTAADFDFG